MENYGATIGPYEPSFWDRLAQTMMGDGRAPPERRRFVEGLLGTSGLGDTGDMSLRGFAVPETAGDAALMALGPAARYGGQAASKAVGAVAGGLLGSETSEAQAGVLGGARKGSRNILQRLGDTGGQAAQPDGTYWHDISKNKLSRPLEEMSATHVPKEGILPERMADIEKLQGGVLIPAIGDRTAAGSHLTHINERPLAQPVDMMGGANFTRSAAAQSSDASAWASERGIVSRLAKDAQRAGESGRDPYLVYTAMSNRAGDYSHMMTDALLAQLPDARITKKAMRDFDETMKGHDPEWPGLQAPNIREHLLAGGSLRTRMAEEMAKSGPQNAGFPDIGSTRFAITDPRLLNEQSGASGYAIAKIDPSGRVIKDPVVPHTTYNTQLGGAGYVGGLETMVPRNVMWPDYYAGLTPELLSNSAKADYAFTRAMPKQVATQQWLDGVFKYLEGAKQ